MLSVRQYLDIALWLLLVSAPIPEASSIQNMVIRQYILLRKSTHLALPAADAHVYHADEQASKQAVTTPTDWLHPVIHSSYPMCT